MFALTVALLLGDIQHVVQRGHTIEAIAHRYHVSVKAIVDANHLKDPGHLKPGEVLTIPGVDATKKKGDKPEKGDKDNDKAGHDKPAHPTTTAALMPAPEPRGHFEADVVHAERLGEEFRIRVKDGHGHIPPSALAAFERMMRQGNATHPIDPRLVALVGIVSSHFGGKTLEVVSGFRAYSPTQYTPHSNHNLGRALDFRVRGVSNEVLRDFCRTLRSAGCGYYPNSSFVHLDVRETKAYWVDWSHPGEPPKYDKPDAGADEGTSDVPSDEDGHEGSTSTAPAPTEDRGATQPTQGQD
ncbi:MAG TPA: DUF882 domain-containing protein [Acidimicrobiales bacterium]|nr:DUF882 domain-containing protein [Acidimicrobiales bacterium]